MDDHQSRPNVRCSVIISIRIALIYETAINRSNWIDWGEQTKRVKHEGTVIVVLQSNAQNRPSLWLFAPRPQMASLWSFDPSYNKPFSTMSFSHIKTTLF